MELHNIYLNNGRVWVGLNQNWWSYKIVHVHFSNFELLPPWAVPNSLGKKWKKICSITNIQKFQLNVIGHAFYNIYLDSQLVCRLTFENWWRYDFLKFVWLSFRRPRIPSGRSEFFSKNCTVTNIQKFQLSMIWHESYDIYLDSQLVCRLTFENWWRYDFLKFVRFSLGKKFLRQKVENESLLITPPILISFNSA